MNDKITGGCKCGAVRYEVSAAPKAYVICQCRDCQKFSGSGNLASMMVPADKLTVTGETTKFEYTGGSGNPVHHVFCPVCGSPVYGGPPGYEFSMIRAGSLDDPRVCKRGMVVYSESAALWGHVDSNILRHAGTS